MPLSPSPGPSPTERPKTDAEDLAKKIERRLLRAMRQALIRGEVVDLVGLGRLEVRARKARRLIHPASGQAIELEQGHALFFRPDKSLVKDLNKQSAPDVAPDLA